MSEMVGDVLDFTTPMVAVVDDCPCPPPAGGAGGTTPQGTGPFGGGGSGNSGDNEGGDGWTPGSLCAGGGTVNSYTTASAGESMVGVRDPRIWVEVAFASIAADDTETAAPAYWSQDVAIPDAPASYGGLKEGRVLGFSRIARSLSDDNGNYVGPKVTIRLNDKDRASLRTRLGSSTGQYVWEREAIIRLASETNRRTGYSTAPRELFRGVTRDISPGAGFTGSMGVEDRISSQFGEFGPDRSFSSRLLTTGLLPDCPRDLVGKPQQWIFGEVSDLGAVHPDTGVPAEKGLVPIWYVGTDGGNDVYHLAAHETGDVLVYGSDGGDPATRVLIGYATIDTRDLVDSDTGETHRMTVVLVPTGSEATESHKLGRINMAVNVCGVAGANSLLITDLFLIYQYIFEHLVLPPTESLTGAYVGSPQWADGRYMVQSASFAAAQAYSATRIGGDGYQGAFVLGGPGQGAVTLRELLRRMSNSGDCWFTWSHGGQLKVVLLDDTASLTSTPQYGEPDDLREMPTPEYAFDEVENPVLFSYDYDDDKRRFRVAQETATDAPAIVRMTRPRPSPSPIAMRCIRDARTARDVAQRRLLRRKYPPAYYPVTLPIDGVDREPGDIIRITSQEGAGSGSTDRPLWVRDWVFDPVTKRTHLYCRDLTGLIVDNSLLAESNPSVWTLEAESGTDVLRLR